MVIRPSRESARGWTRDREAGRAPSHDPLNEPGLALNVFWLPGQPGGGRALRTDESLDVADRSVTRTGRDTLEPDG